MKRRTLPLLFAGAALTALSGLAFIDNISVVVRWHRAFKAVAGDAAQMPGSFEGILPVFDFAAVDYSCVTTFIPFFGFLLFTIALGRIAAGCACRKGSFPFFRSYDQMNVALGLVGTLWGIIMIGYYDMDTVTMADLMACLHTALFSTLAAVVWVFLIVHPLLVPLARNVLSASGLEDDDGEKALVEILDDLRAAARGVGSVLEEEREAAARFAASMRESADAAAAISEVVDKSIGNIERRESAAESFFRLQAEGMTSAVSKAESAMAEALQKAVAQACHATGTAADETVRAVKAALAAMDEARKAGDSAVAAAFAARLEAMDAADMERRKKFAEALKARLDAFEQEQEARQKRFDEILDARIERLLKESRENAERADKAESALGRIRAAMR